MPSLRQEHPVHIAVLHVAEQMNTNNENKPLADHDTGCAHTSVPERARSSGVERSVHIGKVVGSRPSAPTIAILALMLLASPALAIDGLDEAPDDVECAVDHRRLPGRLHLPLEPHAADSCRSRA